ncbi:MAG: hypothetical protein ACRCXT_13135 [Paraclostridium sp.]
MNNKCSVKVIRGGSMVQNTTKMEKVSIASNQKPSFCKSILVGELSKLIFLITEENLKIKETVDFIMKDLDIQTFTDCANKRSNIRVILRSYAKFILIDSIAKGYELKIESLNDTSIDKGIDEIIDVIQSVLID